METSSYIHIGAEVATGLTLTAYLVSENKKLKAEIVELKEDIKTVAVVCADKIRKLDEVIKYMITSNPTIFSFEQADTPSEEVLKTLNA